MPNSLWCPSRFARRMRLAILLPRVLRLSVLKRLARRESSSFSQFFSTCLVALLTFLLGHRDPTSPFPSQRWFLHWLTSVSCRSWGFGLFQLFLACFLLVPGRSVLVCPKDLFAWTPPLEFNRCTVDDLVLVSRFFPIFFHRWLSNLAYRGHSVVLDRSQGHDPSPIWLFVRLWARHLPFAWRQWPIDASKIQQSKSHMVFDSICLDP